jgi:recombination protein RecR
VDKTFDYLLDVLKSLPGVGTKQAKQIAYFLLNKDERYIEEFISRIRGVKQNIHFCEKCNNLVEGKYICDICSSSKRNTTKICVISSSEDLNKIEDTKSFDGIYFVLNDEVDLKKGSSINPDTVRKFMTMLKTNKVNEVILANN